MARAARLYAPMTIGPENVVRRRPADMGAIYGHSPNEVHPLTPAILDRPGWQGRYSGASVDFNPGITNETLIVRSRDILFRRPYRGVVATGPGNINWADSGPTRDLPTFRFSRNIRPLVGGSHASRWGLHTNIPSGQQMGNQLTGRKSMKAAKQNRLTVQRYRGQSYSSSTQVWR